jgi:hypothetical protein
MDVDFPGLVSVLPTRGREVKGADGGAVAPRCFSSSRFACRQRPKCTRGVRTPFSGDAPIRGPVTNPSKPHCERI